MPTLATMNTSKTEHLSELNNRQEATTTMASAEATTSSNNTVDKPSTSADLTAIPSYVALVDQEVLEGFLSLVEPTADKASTHSEGTVAAGDSLSTRSESKRASECSTIRGGSGSQTPLHETTDPRLAALKQDQLQPIASLFTKFYEEQATSTNDVLPKYQRAVDMMDLPEDSRAALSEVLAAIDRLAVMTGDTFLEQRVTLSPLKEEELAANALAQRIIRLSKRLDSQRVDLNQTRRSALDSLATAIERSGQQFTNQRVSVDPVLDRRMQAARICAIVEKMDRTRLENQDWLNPELLRENDMEQLTERMQRVPSSYLRQRYIPSGKKQRDMFIEDIMKRVRRMGSRRMENQDAEMPKHWRHLMSGAPKRHSMTEFERSRDLSFVQSEPTTPTSTSPHGTRSRRSHSYLGWARRSSELFRFSQDIPSD